MSYSFQRVTQQISLFAVLLMVMLIGGSASFVSLNARFALTLITLLGTLITIYTFRDGFPDSPVHRGWLLFALATLLSTLNSDIRRSIELWLLPLGFQIPVYFAVVALRWKAQFWIRAILLSGVVLFLQAALQIITYLASWRADLPPGVLFPPLDYRLSGVLDNPNVFGAVLATMIPLAITYGLSSRAGERLLCGLWIIGAGICLLATGSRGALIGTAIGVFCALFLMNGQRLTWLVATRQRRIALIGALLIGFVLLVGVVLYLSAGSTRATAVGQRFKLWQTALTVFSHNPIFGAGYGSYPVEWMKAISAPPTTVERHAHNILFHLLAETGIIGSIALFVFIGALIQGTIRAWRASTPRQHLILSGLIGGMIAFGVFGLTDNPMLQAAPFLMFTICCALLTSFEPKASKAKTTKAVAVALSISVSLLSVVLLILYIPQWQGARDTAQTPEVGYDPADALIRLQAGVAWARRYYANGDQNALNQAINFYRQGIARHGDSAVQHLNLAVLLEHTDSVAALSELAIAARQAPASAVIHLNYGLALEKAGQNDDARAEYIRALTLNGYWRFSSFWDGSSVRKAALNAVVPDMPFVTALQAADYQKAFDSATEQTDQLLARGLIAWKKDDLVNARFYLKAASLSDGANVTLAWLYRGDLAASEGDLNAMQTAYQTAFSRLDRYGTFGPGTFGETTYAVNVFGRYGYVTDYLPDVVLLDITPFESARFTILARLYSASDNQTAADHILGRISVNF